MYALVREHLNCITQMGPLMLSEGIQLGRKYNLL